MACSCVSSALPGFYGLSGSDGDPFAPAGQGVAAHGGSASGRRIDARMLQLSASMAVFRVVIPGVQAVAQQGFLLIADITGYTMFLTRSELEHAQGILDTLFKSIFAEIKAPIILSNLQGDAALTHLPDVNLPQRQFPLDAIERIYCSFSHALGAMRVNTTCTCNACRNMNQLDLKFFLHHGTYATQQMAGGAASCRARK